MVDDDDDDQLVSQIMNHEYNFKMSDQNRPTHPY